SLLAQQIATGLATGRHLWGRSCAPVHVLYWACEDNSEEIWRRQYRICRLLGLEFSALGNLHVDARCGLDNALFASDYAAPCWTPLIGELRSQINRFQAQVLILDNLSQVYGANENDRHHVTTFLNGIIGLVPQRAFCPIFLGHLSKSPSSEYSGSTAWENAVRMRWYLTEQLPDQKPEDNSPDPGTAG